VATGKTIKRKPYKKTKGNNKKGVYQAKLYEMIPLLMAAGLVPLIILVKKVTFTDAGNMFQDGSNGYYDLFTYYKMAVLLISTAAGLVFYLFSRTSNDLKAAFLDKEMKSYYILMGIYVLLVIISTILSEYGKVALWGFRERFEGAFVLISYMVLAFLAANILREEKLIKILFACILVSSFIISVIGNLQLLELDYFKSKFVIQLISLPLQIDVSRAKLDAKFPPRTVFSTLYNPNYVGSYMAMIIPILLVFLVRIKKIAHKLMLGLLLCLTAICAVGAKSSAGIVGIVFSLIIILIMLRKHIFKNWKIASAIAAVTIAGILAVNFAAKGALFNKLGQMAADFIQGDTDSEVLKEIDERLQGLQDLIIEKDKALFITDEGTLTLSVIDGKLVLFDENDKNITYNIEDANITIPDDRFERISINIVAEEGEIGVNYNDYRLINIYLTDEGLQSPDNRWMTLRGVNKIEAIGFKGKESIGSNRGYLWSRTLPIVKETVLIGKGPDTYPMYFPQYDYLNKLKLYGSGNIFVDKPHNMYLQIAVNTGVISLLAILAIFIIYFIASVRLYFRERFDSFLSIAGLACFAAFCGYAATGMFNDSVVSVAPVFWVLLGLGMGINAKLTRDKGEYQNH